MQSVSIGSYLRCTTSGRVLLVTGEELALRVFRIRWVESGFGGFLDLAAVERGYYIPCDPPASTPMTHVFIGAPAVTAEAFRKAMAADLMYRPSACDRAPATARYPTIGDTIRSRATGEDYMVVGRVNENGWVTYRRGDLARQEVCRTEFDRGDYGVATAAPTPEAALARSEALQEACAREDAHAAREAAGRALLASLRPGVWLRRISDGALRVIGARHFKIGWSARSAECTPGAVAYIVLSGEVISGAWERCAPPPAPSSIADPWRDEPTTRVYCDTWSDDL